MPFSEYDKIFIYLFPVKEWNAVRLATIDKTGGAENVSRTYLLETRGLSKI